MTVGRQRLLQSRGPVLLLDGQFNPVVRAPGKVAGLSDDTGAPEAEAERAVMFMEEGPGERVMETIRLG